MPGEMVEYNRYYGQLSGAGANPVSWGHPPVPLIYVNAIASEWECQR